MALLTTGLSVKPVEACLDSSFSLDGARAAEMKPRDALARPLSSAPGTTSDIVASIRIAAEESGIDPYLLTALLIVESGGRVDVRSRRGALGLFQLTLVSAQWRARELGLLSPTEEELLTDPLLNARLGADNLSWLLETYDGDEVRALCAYNAGTRRLKRMTDAAGGWGAWLAEHERAGDSQLLDYAYRVLGCRDDLRAQGTLEPRSISGD